MGLEAFLQTEQRRHISQDVPPHGERELRLPPQFVLRADPDHRGAVDDGNQRRQPRLVGVMRSKPGPAVDLLLDAELPEISGLRQFLQPD